MPPKVQIMGWQGVGLLNQKRLSSLLKRCRSEMSEAWFSIDRDDYRRSALRLAQKAIYMNKQAEAVRQEVRHSVTTKHTSNPPKSHVVFPPVKEPFPKENIHRTKPDPRKAQKAKDQTNVLLRSYREAFYHLFSGALDGKKSRNNGNPLEKKKHSWACAHNPEEQTTSPSGQAENKPPTNISKTPPETSIPGVKPGLKYYSRPVRELDKILSSCVNCWTSQSASKRLDTATRGWAIKNALNKKQHKNKFNGKKSDFNSKLPGIHKRKVESSIFSNYIRNEKNKNKKKIRADSEIFGKYKTESTFEEVKTSSGRHTEYTPSESHSDVFGKFLERLQPNKKQVTQLLSDRTLRPRSRYTTCTNDQSAPVQGHFVSYTGAMQGRHLHQREGTAHV